MSTYVGLAAAAPLFEPGASTRCCCSRCGSRPSTARGETGAPDCGAGLPRRRPRRQPRARADPREMAAGTAYWRRVCAAGDDPARPAVRPLAATGAVPGAPLGPPRPASHRRAAGGPAAAFPRSPSGRGLEPRGAPGCCRTGLSSGLPRRRTGLAGPGADLPTSCRWACAPAGRDHPDQPTDGLPSMPQPLAGRLPRGGRPGMGLVVALEVPTSVRPADRGRRRPPGPATGADRVQPRWSRTTPLRPDTLPLGTPTNNTPGTAVGWRSREPARPPDVTARRRAAFDPDGPPGRRPAGPALGVDGLPVLAAVCDPAEDDATVLRHAQLKADDACYCVDWHPAGPAVPTSPADPAAVVAGRRQPLHRARAQPRPAPVAAHRPPALRRAPGLLDGALAGRR